jgi:hypothetical protein
MKSRMTGILLLVLLSLGATSSALADAYGKVGSISVVNAGNMPFRVSLVGIDHICPTISDNWAYLNEYDASYKSWMATLIAARVSDTYVSLQTSLDSNSRCRINLITWTPTQ